MTTKQEIENRLKAIEKKQEEQEKAIRKILDSDYMKAPGGKNGNIKNTLV